MKTVIGVNGACGRMGLRLVQLAHEDKEFEIGAALDAPSHPNQGRDVGEIAGVGKLNVGVISELPLSVRLDVMIDFSTAQGTMAILPACVDRRIPLIVATTGYTAQEREQIESAAHETALLFSPNLSLAVNTLFKLVGQAAKILSHRNFDVEIIERHHRFKRDAPSGTALHLAKIVQEEMGQTRVRHGREGMLGERPDEEIGIHALRGGDNVGEHTICFTALGETLELTHRAHSRDCYARGALLAAKYLADRPAGRYTMGDVLGL
jgi:4-hydroxy-tetrahydrodipicolinate reductase